MNKREIEKAIRNEEKYIKSLKDKIEGIKFDIKGSRKAIAFWKKELNNKKNSKEG